MVRTIARARLWRQVCAVGYVRAGCFKLELFAYAARGRVVAKNEGQTIVVVRPPAFFTGLAHELPSGIARY